jgi:hypothetical protein
MQNQIKPPSRRAFVKLAGITAAGSIVGVGSAGGELSLFDGKTLDRWIQMENSAMSLPIGGITDPAAFAAKLSNGPDAVSVFLRGQLQDSVKADMAAFSTSSANAKAVISALMKELNQVISGPSIYDKARFSNIVRRPETEQLLQQNPHGQQLARLNKLLLEDAYPGELAKSSTTGWVVKDSAMASTGAGRGVIYTANDYSRYRLMFTMRHISGNPDHQAVSGSQRWTLGLSAGNEQQRGAGVHVRDEDSLRRARMEPRGDTGRRRQGNSTHGGRAAAREQSR